MDCLLFLLGLWDVLLVYRFMCLLSLENFHYLVTNFFPLTFVLFSFSETSLNIWGLLGDYSNHYH